jgi:hypothetical protein
VYFESDSRIKLRTVFYIFKGCNSSKNQSSSKFVFIKESLDQHYRYRYIHRVLHVKLNKELCTLAQEWAQIANSGKFEHSNHKYLNHSPGKTN